MEKNVLLYTCNMLYIFLYQIFNVKKFNQRNLIKLNFQTKPRYIKKKESVFIIIYTSKFINVLSFIISIIIYLFINVLFHSNILKTEKIEFKVDLTTQENFIQNSVIDSENFIQNQTIDSENIIKDNTLILEETNTLQSWYIQIDKIGLKAPIQEGTTQKVMEDYVGHFEESSKDLGNVCLAAHNRGYKNNYFSRLKELQEGDEIKYIYKNIEKTYIVTKHEIIQNTDWSNLEPTEENTITLITCVENEPEYRRCIQGIEKFK